MRGALEGMVAAALVAAPARAACDASAGPADIEAAAEQAERRFGALDHGGFVESTDRLSALVICAGVPLEQALAARIHRARGLRAFVDDQPERAKQAFVAARALEPDFLFATSLIPEGHPVGDAYGAIPVALGVREVVPRPLNGALYFDGSVSLERPGAWPTLIQRIDREGVVLQSAYLWPGEPMIDYPRPRDVTRLRRGLGWGAGGAALIAAGLYAGAAASFLTWRDPSTEYERLDGLKAWNRGLTIGAGAAGAAALGLGVSALVVGRF